MTAADPRDGLDKRIGYALVRVLQEDYAPIRELARSMEITFVDGEPCIAHARPEAVDEAAALALFTEYFVTNYPGPQTIISDPNWHAPRIFRAAKYAMKASLAPERAP